MLSLTIVFLVLSLFLNNAASRSIDDERRLEHIMKILEPCACNGPQCHNDSHCKYGGYTNRCGNVVCYQGPGAQCDAEALCHQSLKCSCNRCLGTHPITKEEFYNLSASDCSRDYGQATIWNYQGNRN